MGGNRTVQDGYDKCTGPGLVRRVSCVAKIDKKKNDDKGGCKPSTVHSYYTCSVS